MWNNNTAGTYQVIYVNLGNKDAAIIYEPGQDVAIVLHQKLKGLDNLDIIIALVEALKTLTPRQRLQEQVLFWESSNRIYRVPGNGNNWAAGRVVQFNRVEAQADFCMN